MIDDCIINNLAKNQVFAVFNSRAIRRSVSSKFIEICMGRHVGAHLDGQTFCLVTFSLPLLSWFA